MKKIFALLLALAMCFSLCACGKSEAVTNVEGLIGAIGEVTAESQSAIAAAEEAYDALPEEEKATVENYAVLTAAKDSLRELKISSIVGEWVNEFNKTKSISFSADGKFNVDGYEGTWDLNETGATLDIKIGGVSPKISVIEEDGFMKLNLGFMESVECYVRAEDYQDAFDKKFVAVDLSPENVKDYLGEPVRAGYWLDAWGEEDRTRPMYILTSNVYDDGLVYIGCSDDFAIEIIMEDGFLPTEPWTQTFGPFNLMPAYEDEFSYWLPTRIGEKAKGTLYYVREEYVAENSIITQDDPDIASQTYLKLTNGAFYYTGNFGHASSGYEEYLR